MKESLTKIQRQVNTAIRTGTIVDQKVSEGMAVLGIESEEKEIQRLEIEAAPIADIRMRLQEEFPRARRTGSQRQLRYSLLCEVRGQTPMLQEPDEADTEESLKADELQMREAKLALAEKARRDATKEIHDIRKLNKSEASLKDPVQKVLSVAAMKKVYEAQLRDMSLKLADVKDGYIVVCIYGTEGVPPGPGHGRTPGMPRAIEILDMDATTEYLAAHRLEEGGIKPNKTFRMYDKQELDKWGFAKVSKTQFMELLKTMEATLKDVPDNAESIGCSTLSTPRGGAGSLEGQGSTGSGEGHGSTGSGSTGPGSLEGQARQARAMTLEEIDSALADPGIPIIGHQGTVLKGLGRKSFLSAKRRRLA